MYKKVVGIYWDKVILYDSMSRLLVVKEMIGVGFDPVFLAISMQFHQAPISEKRRAPLLASCGGLLFSGGHEII